MRHFNLSTLQIFAVGSGLIAATSGQAQSFSGLISGRLTEAIRLKADTQAYYYSASGTLDDLDRFDSPPVIETNEIGGTYNASVSSRSVPTSPLDKDYGTAQVSFTYTNGGPAAPDSLLVQLGLHGSAQQAMVGTPPKPASLLVRAAISYVLLGEPDGGRFRLTLPAIPSLHDAAHERLSAELSGPGMSPIRRDPGAAPLTVELDGTKNYVFEIGYTLDVPYGTDPDYSYAFAGGGFEVASVPEPAETALGCGLVLGLWGVARKWGWKLRRPARR